MKIKRRIDSIGEKKEKITEENELNDNTEENENNVNTNNDIDETNRIEIIDVKKTFQVRKNDNKNNDTEFVALNGINLQIKKGEFIVILGPSGCGKSTLLDIIGGLSTPDIGELFIDNKLVTGPGLDRGIVFQQYALLPWRNALDNVKFPLEATEDKETQKKIAKKYLSLVGLSGFEDRYPHELSGGMKQRVAIARALAINPEILLMDEPFAAVDAQTRELLQIDLLKITKETNKTVVFITHSIDEAILLADRVAILTARPGTIKEIVKIPVSREYRSTRDFKNTSEFTRLRQKIWELLKEEVLKSQEISEPLIVENEVKEGEGI
jgi:NitT/TauT family transport system ATP-binding protein